MDFRPEDSPTVENDAQCPADQRRCQVTIDTLTDDAILYVFDFYVAQSPAVETWHSLVHVCRRWRTLVFASPRRLNLRIAITNKIPSGEKLAIWPALPIVISGECHATTDTDNIEAALKLNDRVCQIKLSLMSELGKIFAALEGPYPALTDLNLYTYSHTHWRAVFPKFLSGSTHLRSLSLSGLSIPGLPKLLLSSTDLVNLCLDDIPMPSLFPPETIVTTLSALTRLKVLHLRLGPFHPDWEYGHLPLPPHATLPSLSELKFEGPREYLEDLVARIDVPQLDRLDMIIFTFALVIILDTPQLLRFISRAPKLQAPNKARVAIDTVDHFQVEFWQPGQISRIVRLKIITVDPEWQFRWLAQFCRSPLFPLPTLESLYFDGGQYSVQHQQDNDESTRWLELLRAFTPVKNLFLSMDFAPPIARALQGLVGEGAMEVLPSLENVFIEEFQPSGSVHESIGQFVAKRQRSGWPVVVSRWDRIGTQRRRGALINDTCSISQTSAAVYC